MLLKTFYLILDTCNTLFISCSLYLITDTCNLLLASCQGNPIKPILTKAIKRELASCADHRWLLIAAPITIRKLSHFCYRGSYISISRSISRSTSMRTLMGTSRNTSRNTSRTLQWVLQRALWEAALPGSFYGALPDAVQGVLWGALQEALWEAYWGASGSNLRSTFRALQSTLKWIKCVKLWHSFTSSLLKEG